MVVLLRGLAELFCVIFHDIHKKQVRISSNSGYKKICGGKIYSRTRTFGSEVHKSNVRVKDGTTSIK